MRNITDFTRQFKNSYIEDDIVDRFEEIFTPKSNVVVLEVVNVIWILRSLFRRKKEDL